MVMKPLQTLAELAIVMPLVQRFAYDHRSWSQPRSATEDGGMDEVLC